MSKQEGIRDGVEDIIHRNWNLDPELEVEKIFKYLHSQGVVIKVDRELPENPYMGNPTKALSYKEAQKDMIDAGYVAIEPIGGD